MSTISFGIITDIVDYSGPVNLSPNKDGRTVHVSYITNDLSKGNLKELGIDLSDNDLCGVQKGQLEDLPLSYADVF